MRGFVVMKPGGTTSHEFEAYKAFLEEIGIDLSNVPRVPEPGPARRWLYAWRDREAAQASARELGRRTRDSSWTVQECDLPEEESGPLAPLDVIAEPVAAGTLYRLSTASQERIMRRFPNARLAGEVILSHQAQRGYEQDRGPGPSWDRVIGLLSGLSLDQLNELGGYRVYEAVVRTLYESAAAT
ncbi:MAG: hypothetical protein ACLQGP_27035 [Isosphaeraceae bacterium]